jgi:hypothetical protein
MKCTIEPHRMLARAAQQRVRADSFAAYQICKRNAGLKMDSAIPHPGLFALPPQTLADSLASKEVSPQGTAAGLRLLEFYISHAAQRLSPARLRRLEKARKLLAARMEHELKHKSAA